MGNWASKSYLGKGFPAVLWVRAYAAVGTYLALCSLAAVMMSHSSLMTRQ